MTLSDEAQAYFYDMGLTYADVLKEDVEMLCSMLDVELRSVRYLRPITASADRLSCRAGTITYAVDREHSDMASAFVGMFRHGDEHRAGISFWSDGRITFCGWARDEIRLPVVEAFKDWCDLMAMRKQALEVESGEVGA